MLGQVYRLGDSTYRIYRRDARVLRDFEEICAAMPDQPSRTWLLRHRKTIRYIKDLQPAAVLTLLSVSQTDTDSCKLALWLRGFCCSKVGANELLQLALQNNSEIQVAVATTLHRIGAWSQLRSLLANNGLAEEEFDLGHLRKRRDFAESLEKFLKKIPRREIPKKLCPVFIADGTPKAGKSAKPKWLIRLILDRVRLLVSAKQSTDRLPTTFTDEAP